MPGRKRSFGKDLGGYLEEAEEVLAEDMKLGCNMTIDCSMRLGCSIKTDCNMMTGCSMRIGRNMLIDCSSLIENMKGAEVPS